MLKAIGGWFADILKLVIVKVITFILVLLAIYLFLRYFLKVDIFALGF